MSEEINNTLTQTGNTEYNSNSTGDNRNHNNENDGRSSCQQNSSFNRNSAEHKDWKGLIPDMKNVRAT